MASSSVVFRTYYVESISVENFVSANAPHPNKPDAKRPAANRYKLTTAGERGRANRWHAVCFSGRHMLTPVNTQTSDYDVICFSHLRWQFVFQRPQHLLTRCARKRRVFYIEE